MNFLTLSIITVVKNDEKNIEKTIKSVLNQKNIKLEYIVIDGNSSDKTLAIINNYKKNINKIISENDNGIYDAMNKGIINSTGDIIAFCNSGDFFYDNSLSKVTNLFNNKDLDYVFGSVLRNYMGGNQILKYNLNPNRIFYNFDFATAHSTGFFLRRDVYKKIGYYNTKFECSADYDLYFRLIKKKYKGTVTGKKDIIGNVARGGKSSKVSFFNHILEEAKIRLHNKQNSFVVLLIFINSIIKNPLKSFNINTK
jgi:glycosyltransferase involved in cell wall biosynthesis